MEMRKVLPPLRIDLLVRPCTRACRLRMRPDRPGNRHAYAYAHPTLSGPTPPFPNTALLSMGAMLFSEHALRLPLASRQTGKGRRCLDSSLLRKLWLVSGDF